MTIESADQSKRFVAPTYWKIHIVWDNISGVITWTFGLKVKQNAPIKGTIVGQSENCRKVRQKKKKIGTEKQKFTAKLRSLAFSWQLPFALNAPIQKFRMFEDFEQGFKN